MVHEGYKYLGQQNLSRQSAKPKSAVGKPKLTVGKPKSAIGKT